MPPRSAEKCPLRFKFSDIFHYVYNFGKQVYYNYNCRRNFREAYYVYGSNLSNR